MLQNPKSAPFQNNTTRLNDKQKRNYNYLILGLAAIGFATTLKVSYHILKGIYKGYSMKQNHFDYLKKRYGEKSWIVITGVTDGIGKQLALRFAEHNFNIVLVARNQVKINNVIEELKKINPKIDTKSVILDFSNVPYIDNIQSKPKIQEKSELNQIIDDCNKNDYNTYIDTIKTLDISMLFNNAGVTYTCSHHELTPNQIIELINVNCISPSIITNLTLPYMLKRSYRSAIINTSSFLAIYPYPFLATYSGSKAFLHSFSNSLAIEYNDKIDILSMTPYYISTKMTKYQKIGYDTISADEYVDICIKNIGYSNWSYGHYKHFIMHLIYKYIPNKYLKKWQYDRMKLIADQIKKIEQLKLRRRKQLSKLLLLLLFICVLCYYLIFIS